MGGTHHPTMDNERLLRRGISSVPCGPDLISAIMVRHFNPIGLCHPDRHYHLMVKERLPRIHEVVNQAGYFGVHGPRQVGKTTAMSQLADELTAKGRYAAVRVSVGAVSLCANAEDQAARRDGAIAEDAFLYELRDATHALPPDLQPPVWEYQVEGQRIRAALTAWAERCPRPLILFIDDVDTLGYRALLSLLWQLEGGFQHRPHRFPQSIGLIGLRDVNDLPLWSSEVESSQPSFQHSPLAHMPGQVFQHMRAASFRLSAFTVEEVANLYQSHTTATGQLFTLEAVDRAFELTQGQPQLVNALAQRAVQMTNNESIEAHHIDAAKDRLLQAQEVQLAHLTAQLWDPRVKTVVEPVLMGQPLSNTTAQEVYRVVDSGLCRLHPDGGLAIANPLYQDVILQRLLLLAVASFASLPSSWGGPEDLLDAHLALDAFVEQWRSHGDALLQSVPYDSIAPYLVVTAFCHRLVHPHGTLESIYEFPRNHAQLRLRVGSFAMGVSVCVWRQHQPDPMASGVAHLDDALSVLGTDCGWLVVVDQRQERLPDRERTQMETARTLSGKDISVIRA